MGEFWRKTFFGDFKDATRWTKRRLKNFRRLKMNHWRKMCSNMNLKWIFVKFLAIFMSNAISRKCIRKGLRSPELSCWFLPSILSWSQNFIKINIYSWFARLFRLQNKPSPNKNKTLTMEKAPRIVKIKPCPVSLPLSLSANKLNKTSRAEGISIWKFHRQKRKIKTPTKNRNLRYKLLHKFSLFLSRALKKQRLCLGIEKERAKALIKVESKMWEDNDDETQEFHPENGERKVKSDGKNVNARKAENLNEHSR